MPSGIPHPLPTPLPTGTGVLTRSTDTSPQFRSSSSYASSAAETSATITKPSGLEDGDLLVAFLVLDEDLEITGPTANDWLRIEHSISATGADVAFDVWIKRIDNASSEPANYTFTAAASQFWAGGIVAYSNVAELLPIDCYKLRPQHVQDDTTPSAASITTNTIDTRLLALFGRAAGASTGTPAAPTGMNERFSETTTAGATNAEALFADEWFPAAAATGTREASGFTTGSDGFSMLLALRSADQEGLGDVDTYATEQSDDSPDRWYKLDAINGGSTATDDGADGIDGTVSGSPPEIGDPIGGKAITIQDSGEHVRATGYSDSSLTVEVVARHTGAVGSQPFILLSQTTTDGGDSNDGWNIRLTGSGTNHLLYTTVEGVSGGHRANFEQFYIDQWVHIVARFDPANGIDVWINGIHWQTRTTSWTPDLSPIQQFKIGGQSASLNQSLRYWHGDIADVALYPTLLTEARIIDHYLAFAKQVFGAGGEEFVGWGIPLA